jgi:hypothetical protein
LGDVVDRFLLPAQPGGTSRLPNIFRVRELTGVVVAHMMGPLSPGRRLALDRGGFAAVSGGVPLAYPDLHYVANDRYMPAVRAARELLGLGYRRLGLVVSEVADCLMMNHCSAGFWTVQEALPGLLRLPICRLAGTNLDGFRQWLRERRPDAPVAIYHAPPAVAAELGFRGPENLGWVRLNWVPENGRTAGLRGNSAHTGAAAVDVVVSNLHRG